MCNCLTCKQVPGLENAVAVYGESIGRKWETLKASPGDGELAAECRESVQRFLSALDALKEFASKNFHTLSEHGTRVKYLQ